MLPAKDAEGEVCYCPTCRVYHRAFVPDGQEVVLLSGGTPIYQCLSCVVESVYRTCLKQEQGDL